MAQQSLEDDERPIALLQERVELIARGVFRRKAPPGTVFEDVVQETLLSVLRYAREKPAPPDNLDAFLYFRLRHVVGTLLRRARRGEVLLDDEAVQVLVDACVRPSAGLEVADLEQALRRCVAALEPSFLAAWRCRYVERVQDSLAATRLGITVGALRVRLTRARVTLAKCLQRRGVLSP